MYVCRGLTSQRSTNIELLHKYLLNPKKRRNTREQKNGTLGERHRSVTDGTLKQFALFLWMLHSRTISTAVEHVQMFYMTALCDGWCSYIKCLFFLLTAISSLMKVTSGGAVLARTSCQKTTSNCFHATRFTVEWKLPNLNVLLPRKYQVPTFTVSCTPSIIHHSSTVDTPIIRISESDWTQSETLSRLSGG